MVAIFLNFLATLAIKIFFIDKKELWKFELQKMSLKDNILWCIIEKIAKKLKLK